MVTRWVVRLWARQQTMPLRPESRCLWQLLSPPKVSLAQFVPRASGHRAMCDHWPSWSGLWTVDQSWIPSMCFGGQYVLPAQLEGP